MAYTMEQANALLASINTEADLRTLVSQLDITAEGKVTVLYGGEVGDKIEASMIVKGMIENGEAIRVLDNTEASKFLDIRQNEALANALERIFVDSNPFQPGSTANQFLQGSIVDGKRIPNGAWDNVSSRFVDATVGEVRTLTGGAVADRVFAQTEVPRLLANSNITHVDGIPIDRLNSLSPTEAFKTISAQSAIDSAYLKIATDSNGVPLIVNGQARVDTYSKCAIGR